MYGGYWEGAESEDGLVEVALDSESDETIYERVCEPVVEQRIRRVDYKITVKGVWIACPFCWSRWERTVDSLVGDLIECPCGKFLEVEAVE